MTKESSTVVNDNISHWFVNATFSVINSSQPPDNEPTSRSPGYAAVLFILFATDVLGNSFVCAVTVKRLKEKVSCLQVFILSLAIADLLQGVCQILPLALRYSYGYWTYGSVLCKTHAMTRSLSSNTSVFTMVFIAILRYRTVDKLQCPYTHIGPVVALGIWVFNIGVSVPYAIWFEVVDNACLTREELFHNAQVFTMVTRLTNFFIPLAICCVCYIGVIKKTLQSAKRLSNIVGTNTIRRVKVNRNVTVTCMLVLCAFAVTWTPFQIVMILVYSTSPPVSKQLRPLIKYFWLPTAVNSCINPFIYGCLWKNFRSGAKEFLGICRRSRVAPENPVMRKQTTIVRDRFGDFSFTNVQPIEGILSQSPPTPSTSHVRELRKTKSCSNPSEKKVQQERMVYSMMRRHTTAVASVNSFLYGALPRQDARRQTIVMTTCTEKL